MPRKKKSGGVNPSQKINVGGKEKYVLWGGKPTKAVKKLVHQEDKEKKLEKKARLRSAFANKTADQQALSRAILAYGSGSNYFKFMGDAASANKLRAEAREAGAQLKALGGRTIRRKKSERVKRTVYHGKKQKQPEESSSMEVERKPRKRALTKRRKAK